MSLEKKLLEKFIQVAIFKLAISGGKGPLNELEEMSTSNKLLMFYKLVGKLEFNPVELR